MMSPEGRPDLTTSERSPERGPEAAGARAAASPDLSRLALRRGPMRAEQATTRPTVSELQHQISALDALWLDGRVATVDYQLLRAQILGEVRRAQQRCRPPRHHRGDRTPTP